MGSARPASARWRSGPGVLVLVVLVLQAACAPGALRGGPLEGDRLRLPTDFGAVRLEEAAFQQAMADLLLEVPLRVASAPSPLYASRKWVPASARPVDEPWRSELGEDYGRYCVRCCTPGDCLGLFQDGSRFDAEDKSALALALAVGPALEARDAELRSQFSPAQLVTTVGVTLAGYLALLAMPEPASGHLC